MTPERSEYIARVVAAAAPLTADERDEVWSLLRSVPREPVEQKRGAA